MEVGHHIALTLGAGAPNSSSALSERGQHSQPAQGGTFSALLKDLAQNIPDEGSSSPGESEDPTESTQPGDAGEQAALASVMGIVLVSSVAGDSQAPPSAEEGAESAQVAQSPSPESMEANPFEPKDGSVVQTHKALATGEDSVLIEATPLTTTDLSSDGAQQPLDDPAQSGDVRATPPKQTASRTTDESAIRNDRTASLGLSPVPLIQPSGESALLSPSSTSSLIPGQMPTPVVENQETKNLLVAASVNGAAHPLDRPLTGIQPPIIVADQGTQGTTPLGQTLPSMMMGESGRGQEESFGAEGQGQGEGPLFRSRTNGALESLARDNQSPIFIDQFTSARQTQPSLPGEGTSTVTPAAEQLKMTQAFLGEDRAGHLTVGSGSSHTVHMDLPSHDFGPLSVRISVTDQMVHTQFTTDRSDLGHVLLTRQDQLHQDLTKSGLELGQFQVHIDRHGQQEAPPEGQSRRQGEARGDNRPQQQAEQQEQDEKRQHTRSIQVLSVFA